MTNTIPNVPRELLADLLGDDHDKRIMAERNLLAMLANAPSPAGVDGLEAVATLLVAPADDRKLDTIVVRTRHALGVQVAGRMAQPLCRLSDAQAIIDGLRGEVGAQRAKTCAALKARNDAHEERDRQAQRIGELEGLLQEVRNGLSCENLHHKKSEQHAFDEPCKVLVRIDAALSAGKEGE